MNRMTSPFPENSQAHDFVNGVENAHSDSEGEEEDPKQGYEVWGRQEKSYEGQKGKEASNSKEKVWKEKEVKLT